MRNISRRSVGSLIVVIHLNLRQNPLEELKIDWLRDWLADIQSLHSADRDCQLGDGLASSADHDNRGLAVNIGHQVNNLQAVIAAQRQIQRDAVKSFFLKKYRSFIERRRLRRRESSSIANFADDPAVDHIVIDD